MVRVEDLLLQVYADLIWELHNESYKRKLAILRQAKRIIPGVRFTLNSLILGNYEIPFNSIDDFGDYDWWYCKLKIAEGAVLSDLSPRCMDDAYQIYSNRPTIVRGSKRRCYELMSRVFSA